MNWHTGNLELCTQEFFDLLLLISFARKFLSFVINPILTVNVYKIIIVIMITDR